LQYGLIVWGNTYKAYLNKVCTLQNKAIDTIGGGTWRESATPYYAKLEISKLNDVYLFELVTFMFKIKQLSSNFINYISQLKIIHTKNTRSSQSINYFLPQYKTFKLQRSNKYQGVTLWNNIDNKLKILTSIKLFKNKYKTFLLSKFLPLF